MKMLGFSGQSNMVMDSMEHFYMGISINRGRPIAGWFIMENQ